MGGKERLNMGKRKFGGLWRQKFQIYIRVYKQLDASIFKPDPQAHIQDSINTYLKYLLFKHNYLFLSSLKVNGNR